MKQIVYSLERKHVEKRINVLKLEIDYELTTLHDAMLVNDEEQILKSKETLKNYHREMFRINKSFR